MSRPFMPLYVADYLGDTLDLTDAEHGSYLLLLMHYWRTGGLPKDDARLAQIAATTPAKWKKRRTILVRFFEISGDGIWYHKRVDAELLKAGNISEKRAEAARRKHANAGANALQLHTHAGALPQPQSQERVLDLDPSPSLNTEPAIQNSPSSDGASTNVVPFVRPAEPPEQLDLVSAPASSPPASTAARQKQALAAFEQFWAAYPRKIKRKDAEKAFLRVVKERRATCLSEIMGGLERYKRHKPDHIDWAHGSTWLNGDRWKDDYGDLLSPSGRAFAPSV